LAGRILLFSILPLLALRAISRRRKAANAAGLCPKCGYDLRAHHAGDKCPECGTLISPPRPLA
jgi:ribosomal protein L32